MCKSYVVFQNIYFSQKSHNKRMYKRNKNNFSVSPFTMKNQSYVVLLQKNYLVNYLENDLNFLIFLKTSLFKIFAFWIILKFVSRYVSGRTNMWTKFFCYFFYFFIFLIIYTFLIFFKLFKSGYGCHCEVSNKIDIKK